MEPADATLLGSEFQSQKRMVTERATAEEHPRALVVMDVVSIPHARPVIIVRVGVCAVPAGRWLWIVQAGVAVRR